MLENTDMKAGKSSAGFQQLLLSSPTWRKDRKRTVDLTGKKEKRTKRTSITANPSLFSLWHALSLWLKTTQCFKKTKADQRKLLCNTVRALDDKFSGRTAGAHVPSAGGCRAAGRAQPRRGPSRPPPPVGKDVLKAREGPAAEHTFKWQSLSAISYLRTSISYVTITEGQANFFFFFFLWLGQTYHQTASSSLH